MDVFANSLDDVSAGSSTEFPDRLSLMEARLQTQEDEMTLLKSALSDALRRLRVYDEQIPLLRQHILAVSPAAGRGCSCVSDGASSHRKLSTSSNPDWPKRSSSQSPAGTQGEETGGADALSNQNDKGSPSVSPTSSAVQQKPNPVRLDAGTQTDESIVRYLQHSGVSRQPAVELYDGDQQATTTVGQKGRLTRIHEVESLSLEDALISDTTVLREAVEKTQTRPAEDSQGEPWTRLVEKDHEMIKPTHLRGLQDYRAPIIREQDSGRGSPCKMSHDEPVEEVRGCEQSELVKKEHLPKSSLEEGVRLKEDQSHPSQQHSTASKKETVPSTTHKEQHPSPKTGTMSPVSAIMESEKKLFRRNSSSDKLAKEQQDKAKQKLGKKAVSSANLLTRSPSVENRTKDLVSSSGSSGSRRGTYSQGLSIKMFIRGRPITMYIPSNIQNYEELRMEPPTERLELDWVYGYRGRDCRANLYLLPSGEVVYFIACVVVLYHIDARTQRHYLKHTDCVRCLAVHPDQVRVATGQTSGVDKDGKPLQPFVMIWDSGTLVTLQQIGLGFFERGVSSVAFSQIDSGAFLCVIDDSNEHMMSVWDWAKGVKQAEIKSTNEAVFGLEFNPADSGNIITCGKSHVFFWTWSGGALTKKQGIFGKYRKPKFIQCFVFNGNGDVLTGDSEGNILTWGKSAADIKTLGKGAKETYQIVRQTKAHEGSIFTLCLLQGGALLSGGGKDRKVVRWSADLAPEIEVEIPEQFGAVRTIAEVKGEELLIGTTRNAILRGSFSDGFVPIVQGHVDELWGLATHPFDNVFLSCGHDKQVCLWSGSQHSLEWSTTLEETGLCADFHPNGRVVGVGLNTGRWVVLDIETKDIVSDYTDGNEQLSVVRYSPDGSYLAVGSHDNFIYIYTVAENGRRYTRFGRCTGHSSFITHLDWSKESKFIMSNSGDYEILYWDVKGGCKLLRNRFDSKDREWASYTCVLGFHVIGVWLEGSDGTDINALCRSHNERVVAVADDFCKVHLFQYPCPKPKAPSHRYDGHGSHVTNVRFTHNDSHLISMGGKDTSILQWRVVRVGLDRSRSVSSASTSSVETGSCG
ncbi:echinoderm microtubule-associated protein-like 4 isoform X1 [Acipenser ruthenus]|uniref:echinoderm microtubule-associated protein-like 4 isoform X1 n=1 Tax=Acipenser ruthenus TaxID=7906 RepID=UPI002740452F|nr:echinoderm microtubule-associated protein-like 4 isoform X1 [Acipenser ruthenus]